MYCASATDTGFELRESVVVVVWWRLLTNSLHYFAEENSRKIPACAWISLKSVQDMLRGRCVRGEAAYKI